MRYEIPINRANDLTSGRRIDSPLPRIPLFRKGEQLDSFATFEKWNYVFDLDELLSGLMENNLITASLAYDTWHETDPGRPNCRIVAVLIEDRN